MLTPETQDPYGILFVECAYLSTRTTAQLAERNCRCSRLRRISRKRSSISGGSGTPSHRSISFIPNFLPLSPPFPATHSAVLGGVQIHSSSAPWFAAIGGTAPRLSRDLVKCRHDESSSSEVLSRQVKKGTTPRQLWASDTTRHFRAVYHPGTLSPSVAFYPPE